MRSARGKPKRGLLQGIDAPRRGLALALALCVTSSVACLDAMAPTSKSAAVTITPTTRSTGGTENKSGSRFAITFRVRNPASRTIFLDRFYARTEKLIDQKWVMVMETIPPTVGFMRTIPSGQSLTNEYLVQYLRGISPASPYLEHVRGLYRVRLRLSYLSNGAELLPPEESYSEPFVVNN